MNHGGPLYFPGDGFLFDKFNKLRYTKDMRKIFLIFPVLFLSIANAEVFAATFKEVLQKAEQGDSDAQLEVAARYEDGNGVTKDIQEAVAWYTKSAAQGNSVAQSTLGYIYQYGQGVPRDPQAALLWDRKAAEQGDSYGQLNLAVMLDEGVDVPEDNQQAAEWYWKAARQGQPRAQLNLGVMYMNGEGVEKDLKQAWELLNHVRFTSKDKQAQWLARNSLDKIKKELGVDGPGGPGRFSYPDWDRLQKYVKNRK